MTCINLMLAMKRQSVGCICIMGRFTSFPGLHTFSQSLAPERCNRVVNFAAWSPKQCIYSLSCAGAGFLIRVCLYHSSIWWQVVSFLPPWCLRGLSSPRVQSLLLLYCDISLWPIGKATLSLTTRKNSSTLKQTLLYSLSMDWKLGFNNTIYYC